MEFGVLFIEIKCRRGIKAKVLLYASTDEIMPEILGKTSHIVFWKDNAGEFRRKYLWKLHFYENWEGMGTRPILYN